MMSCVQEAEEGRLPQRPQANIPFSYKTIKQTLTDQNGYSYLLKLKFITMFCFVVTFVSLFSDTQIWEEQFLLALERKTLSIPNLYSYRVYCSLEKLSPRERPRGLRKCFPQRSGTASLLQHCSINSPSSGNENYDECIPNKCRARRIFYTAQMNDPAVLL